MSGCEKYSIIEFPRTSNIKDRKERTKEIIKGLNVNSILDIGGKEYREFCEKNKKRYVCIDLESPLKTGTGGYNGTEDGLTYNGRDLPFGENSFELVIVNFVLHHASNNTLYLLEQIKRVSSKYILIGEDLSEIEYEMEWHKRNFEHQPGGVYRSDEEWKILFRLYGIELKVQYIIKREDDIDPKKIYRSMYLLEKKI